MTTINVSISIILCCVSYVFAAETLSCRLHDDGPYDGQVSVTYDRDQLSIYKYNKTHFVNFLIRDVQVKFDGTFTKEQEVGVHHFETRTNVEGVAKLVGNEKESSLTACRIDLSKNAKFANNVNSSFQVKIMEFAQVCAKPVLCQSLGKVQQDDFIRAKIDNHEFGDNSVMFNIFAEKYPNLNLPSVNDHQLQHTINLLADFWLASLITQMSEKQLGQIKLPDVNETLPGIPIISQGYFSLNGGIFGNLRNFTRCKDVIIRHSGLEFTLEGELRLPEAHISFDRYALKYGLLNTAGKIDIRIDGISFHVKVAINYNSNPCELAVPEINSKVGNFSFNMNSNGLFDKMINGVTTNVVNSYIPNLISLLETKMKEGIKKPLENFNCEEFRP